MTSNNSSNGKVTALVLAGGQGRRMRGRDKGLVTLWGKPMVEHVLDRVGPQVANVVISANRNSEAYARYGFPVLADELGSDWGPLAGVYTALKFSSDDYVLVVPCDAPCLPLDLCTSLEHALGSTGCEIAVAHDGARLQFTVALIPCDLASDLQDYLEQGERRVETWLHRHEVTEVRFIDTPDAFMNVNTDADLEALESKGSC